MDREDKFEIINLALVGILMSIILFLRKHTSLIIKEVIDLRGMILYHTGSYFEIHKLI